MGETRPENMSESLSDTGISASAPSRKLLTVAPTRVFDRPGVFVSTRICEEVKLPALPSKPPLSRDTLPITDCGTTVVRPSRWDCPYIWIPSMENRLLPMFPPRTYTAEPPSAPVVTPGSLWAHRIGSPSPRGETTARIPARSVPSSPMRLETRLSPVLIAAFKVSVTSCACATAGNRSRNVIIVFFIGKVILKVLAETDALSSYQRMLASIVRFSLSGPRIFRHHH